MNLQQFRFVQEAVRRQLNLTEAAKALHTSQPGVSKAIIELEEELGIDIFARHGKRLKRVTEPGEAVLASIEIILREVANLKRIGDHFAMQDSGTLRIATTHTQARYVLPGPVMQLRRDYPKVNVELHQGTPMQVAEMLRQDQADIGIATESLAQFDDLVTLPCYEWQHTLVVPTGHTLATAEPLTLEKLAEYPLITYHASFSGRSKIDEAFAARGLTPRIALEAIDSDVIITYTRTGLGLGLVAEMAVREGLPPDMVVRPLGQLFGRNTTRVAFKRGAWLRQFVLHFTSLLDQRLKPELIEMAMRGHVDDSHI